MPKPFFQGKLDTFCAIYAVLNALRLTHGIQTLKARDILNETLLSLAGKPDALRAVARAGAGTNNIPIDRCSEAGIVVFNTPGANANAVKELAVCALLLASRKISLSLIHI